MFFLQACTVTISPDALDTAVRCCSYTLTLPVLDGCTLLLCRIAEEAARVLLHAAMEHQPVAMRCGRTKAHTLINEGDDLGCYCALPKGCGSSFHLPLHCQLLYLHQSARRPFMADDAFGVLLTVHFSSLTLSITLYPRQRLRNEEKRREAPPWVNRCPL